VSVTSGIWPERPQDDLGRTVNYWSKDMTNAGNAAATPDIRELSAAELNTVAGGLDIGPIHAESGGGLFWIGIGGYGIWGGQGCIGVTTPDRVLGVCHR
jgi:hypothetical protein